MTLDISHSNLNYDLSGDKGIRTPDLFHAMEARYQLRHIPFITRLKREGNSSARDLAHQHQILRQILAPRLNRRYVRLDAIP